MNSCSHIRLETDKTVACIVAKENDLLGDKGKTRKARSTPLQLRSVSGRL